MSVWLNETNQWLTIADHADLTLPAADWAVVVGVWVNDNSGSTFQHVLSNSQAGNNNSLNIYLREASAGTPNRWTMRPHDGAGNGGFYISSITSGADSLFRWVIVQRRAADGQIQLWEVVKDGSAAMGASFSIGSFGSIDGNAWNIGREYGGAADRYFGGGVHMFAILNVSLTSTQMNSIASGTALDSVVSPSNIVCRPNLTYAEATQTDLSGNGHHATPSGYPRSFEDPFGQTVEYGFAIGYPDDDEIDDDSRVIAATQFAQTDWYNNLKNGAGYDRYSGYQGGWSRETVARRIIDGAAIRGDYVTDSHQPFVWLLSTDGTGGSGINSPQDTAYLRWMVMWEDDFDFGESPVVGGVTKTCGVKAIAAGGDTVAPSGQAPIGTDFYTLKLQIFPSGQTGRGLVRFYSYNMDQTGSFPANIEMDVMAAGNFYVYSNRWYTIELMLKANTDPATDGEMKVWIDGQLVGHRNGVQFRTANTLDINQIELNAYYGGSGLSPKDQRVWISHIVYATDYIGPVISPLVFTTGSDEFTTTGTWVEYVDIGTAEHYGDVHYYTTGGTGATATWDFTVPQAGQYNLYAWWWDDPGRPTDVPFTVSHDGGNTTVDIDQTVNGGQWNLIGTYNFTSTGAVEIGDDVSGGSDIVANAIKLVRIGDVPAGSNPASISTRANLGRVLIQ